MRQRWQKQRHRRLTSCWRRRNTWKPTVSIAWRISSLFRLIDGCGRDQVCVTPRPSSLRIGIRGKLGHMANLTQYSEHKRAEALAVVAACGGKVAEAARRVGVPRRTLQRWKDEADNRDLQATASAFDCGKLWPYGQPHAILRA